MAVAVGETRSLAWEGDPKAPAGAATTNLHRAKVAPAAGAATTKLHRAKVAAAAANSRKKTADATSNLQPGLGEEVSELSVV